jgi:NAD(P)-dependent dehydrogenase (short-subunit alcohol dehydrogenase family)
MGDSMIGKVALITGGASGLGRSITSRFAAAGAKVAIADVDFDGGQETEAMIRESGGEASFFHVDLSVAAEVEILVEDILKAFGRLDFACNNAGVLAQKIAPIAEFPEKDWDQVIRHNMKSVFLCMKYELRQMVKEGSGSIVNTASNYGLVGAGHGVNAYVASKHGVIGLTRAAALEYATKGIRVNAVCPGHVETPMTAGYLSDPDRRDEVLSRYPMGRLGTMEEITSTIFWLCSDEASFVTGHAMAVDGGYVAR